ncbi:uncharacterized protein AC631_02106 [Debaryomyces fabryi]|uniref:Ammonia transport outward protein 2 n=1 Tax=Debaryomyces fabryi TaxID=58627 RepID=A0A0V1Q0R2_9ASCO|nr:uncharacterized protein AC631_02106 [Debaryomyces fabryi]KSA02110.1 hypothetical protein AC631_02106 [Debaryomyces fabryi]CUM55307.1 unnamed protein product [Debaryomyces fabryi]
MSTDSIDLKARVSHESYPQSKIAICGDGEEFIRLGNKKFYRHELMTAFGGTLNPDRYAQYPVHQFGNAAALGLAGYSLTTFVLGLYYTGVLGIVVPNVVIGLAMFYGGTIMFLSGTWELVIGNAFAGTVLTSYGCFWFSFGSIYIEAFGISAAYADEPEQLQNAIGFYLIGWLIFTFLMTLLTVKSTVLFFSLFVSLNVLFSVLAAANFTGSASASKAGGIVAIVASILGWFNTFAGVATKQNSYFTANPIPIPIFGKTE